MKLIGIEIIGGSPSVIKNLKCGKRVGWFPFGNYHYPAYRDNIWTYEKDGTSHEDDIAHDLLYKSVCTDSKHSISEKNFAQFNLSFSCIVGPNGSGKSTLLEILFRIINNFSYAILHALNEQGDMKFYSGSQLSYAQGLDARLFFYEYGEPIRSIYCCYENVYWEEYRDGEPNVQQQQISKQIVVAELRNFLQKFFYTICTNYSTYSFNENDYVNGNLLTCVNRENASINGDWIRGLLHKNDGYLVPLVIAPYRSEEGYIEPQREDWLAKQRLSTLGVLYASQNQTLPGGYSVASIEYRFNPATKETYEKKFEDLLINRFPAGNKSGDCARWRQSLRRIWIEEFDQSRYAKQDNAEEIKDAIVAYLCYKTLKICLTYATYGQILGIRELTKEELKTYGNKSYYRVALNRNPDFKSLVAQMLSPKNHSHITLKLRQCVNFLSRYYYKVEDATQLVEDSAINYHNLTIKRFLEDNYRLDKTKSYNEYDRVFELMPPPIFEYDVLFSNTASGKKQVRLESMSSGERHLLNNLSYILYHINNIQSVKHSIYTIPQQHINIVMDEAELYYHPEYQRQLIKNLVRMMGICQVNVAQIKSINFVLVTHSPFVLSDIPHDRILFMKDGQSQSIEDDKKTFAANIHDLLYNQFILDNSIGGIAESLLKQIASLYKKKDSLSVDDRTSLAALSSSYSYMSSHIAEPYTAKTIRFMLSELDVLVEDDELDKMRKQYEELGNRIKQKERNLHAKNSVSK